MTSKGDGRKPMLCDECQFRVGDTHVLIPKKIIEKIEKLDGVGDPNETFWIERKEVLALLKKETVEG